MHKNVIKCNYIMVVKFLFKTEESSSDKMLFYPTELIV